MKQRFTTWRFHGVDGVNVIDPMTLDSAGPRMIGKRWSDDAEGWVLDRENGHFTADQRGVARFSHYFADALNKRELLPADSETAAYFGVPFARPAKAEK